MNKTVYIFLLVLIGFTNAVSQLPCASAVNIFTFSANGANYEIVKEKKSWSVASACAVQRGGYLVEINSQQEQTAVYAGILSASIASNYSPVSDGGGASYIWIGATDKFTEGAWLWDGNNDNVGINFWNGQGFAGANNGSAVAGSFVNWGGKSTTTIKEPDDYLSNQDGGAIALSSWPYGIAGEWNDINITNSLYYIIEYATSTGINSLQELENKITLSPNPSKDKVELTLNQEAKRIELKSIDGKLIKVLSNGNQLIDVSSLNAGIYFISITLDKDIVITKKLVKE